MSFAETYTNRMIKNFYKKFMYSPSYKDTFKRLDILPYDKLNETTVNQTSLMHSHSDISTTPFEVNSNPENVYGPIEVGRLSSVSPFDVYSKKQIVSKLIKQNLPRGDMTLYEYEPPMKEQMLFEYEPPMKEQMIYEYDTPVYFENHYSEKPPMITFDQFEMDDKAPTSDIIMAQIPRPKVHPRPYDWEVFRKPKYYEIPPSYVITGSSVPLPEMEENSAKREPVKTEDDKIDDYEKDYKILPGGINQYLKHKLKFEVDWVTIAKILLKIIIFKKIIKFMIILGLLLFIPKYYKWSNLYNADQSNNSSNYYYDKFHKYKYPKRKRRTTTSTTTTTTTTTTTAIPPCTSTKKPKPTTSTTTER